MLKPKQKEKIIEEFGAHKSDSGSAAVQIALLSKEIDELAKHLKKHPKDNHSRRGLLKMVSRRKTLLEYLKSNNEKRYGEVAEKLGLKK